MAKIVIFFDKRITGVKNVILGMAIVRGIKRSGRANLNFDISSLGIKKFFICLLGSLFIFIFAVIIAVMTTKINEILQITPPNVLLFSSWLSNKGIDTKEQSCYVKSGWIERIARGVYKVAGGSPTLYSAISSYNTQLSKRCHIGASTALDLRGFSHFGLMGKPQAFLFTTIEERLPSWLITYPWDMDVRYSTTSIFQNSSLGIETMEMNGFEILVSSPERAFMECLLLAPREISYMEAFYVMEMLTTLRPKLVQALLELCTSHKVKRMFLYMAEKAKHQWIKALNLDNIPLGSGNRQLSPNGTYISKYDITIPQELADYE